jgi:hypothetical protein
MNKKLHAMSKEKKGDFKSEFEIYFLLHKITDK